MAPKGVSPNIWRPCFLLKPHRLRFSKLRSSRATGSGGVEPKLLLGHFLLDTIFPILHFWIITFWCCKKQPEWKRRGKHWQEVFSFFGDGCFPLKPQRQIASECVWQAPPFLEFPFGIEMDDFQWGYMIQRNHQPKQLVNCPGTTTSATSVSMAAEEMAKSAEALFPHRTPWGGWDHERSRDDDS